MREALFYRKENSSMRCLLCPHVCLIEPDKRGKCKARVNLDGKLNTLVYGESDLEKLYFHVDPIEKKPLYHFYPGSYSLSFEYLGVIYSVKTVKTMIFLNPRLMI